MTEKEELKIQKQKEKELKAQARMEKKEARKEARKEVQSKKKLPTKQQAETVSMASKNSVFCMFLCFLLETILPSRV